MTSTNIHGGFSKAGFNYTDGNEITYLTIEEEKIHQMREFFVR